MAMADSAFESRGTLSRDPVGTGPNSDKDESKRERAKCSEKEKEIIEMRNRIKTVIDDVLYLQGRTGGKKLHANKNLGVSDVTFESINATIRHEKASLERAKAACDDKAPLTLAPDPNHLPEE
ncbi:hypothetical protein EVAR_25388_1 [Eumeta japonica]|uniref:Uncharacterized protein n=1 Tax=Eumeta variegata TaxID=151549 RepID=A0A4C1V6C3_EUMVA|nr:hypothetical protein EVAR_25388_1 [Eumeta japonica]